jgi:hypothetical protein
MRGASLGVIVLGVILLVLGLVNHYALHQNPVAHTSTIVLAVGAVLAVIGFIMMAMGGQSAK